MKILDIYKNPLYTLYQWDVNQFVNVVGINPDMPVSVQFWRAGQTEAFVVESTVSGNTATAAIPNELLREPGELVIYIWQDTGVGEQKGGRTETFFNVPIKERAQPSDYIYDDNVEYISVKTVIEDAQNATTAAQEATEAATAAAQLATDTAADIKQKADSGEFDGKDGTDGKDGAPGAQGEPGQPGADGKSATIAIGTVTTVSPDAPASVTNTGTETDAVFNFEIPKGADGSGGGADIETLEKIAIKTTIEGNPAMSGSSAEWRVPLIEGYGENTQFATQGKQLFDISKVIDSEKVKVADNKITVTNGQYGANPSTPDKFSDFCPSVQVGKTYTLSFKDLGRNLIFLSGANIGWSSGSNKEITQEMLDSRVVFYSLSTGKNVYSDIMLNEGSTVLPHEPYTGGSPSPSPEYPQEIKDTVVTGIKVTGKNLIKINLDRWTEAQKEELKAEMSNDGKIVLNFTSTKQYNLDLYGNFSVNTLKLNSKKSYTISSDVPQDVSIVCRFDIGRETLNSSRKSAVVQNKNYLQQIFISIPSGIIFNGSIYFLLEYGSVATEYEPYKEKTIPFSTPITLRGIPSEAGNVTIDGQKYLSDYIGQKEGVYGVTRFFGVYEVTGTEDFLISSVEQYEKTTYNRYFNATALNLNLSAWSWKSTPGLCNILNYNVGVWDKGGQIGFCFNRNQIHIRLPYPTIGVSEEATSEEKKQAYINYLKGLYDSGKPLKILYPLENPTFEPLPAEDVQAFADLKTFYPTSIISWETEDGTEAWTRAQIIHDPKNYIDEQISNAVTQAITLAQGGTA